MDFRFFYDPYDPAIRMPTPGSSASDTGPTTGILRPLRDAQFRGQDRQLPGHQPQASFRRSITIDMYRTLPEQLGPQEQAPRA